MMYRNENILTKMCDNFDEMDDSLFDEEESYETLFKRKCNNSWHKKRQYKKKLIRRFLSINSALDYSKMCGSSCPTGIYVHTFVKDGEYEDEKTKYWFNPYTKIFLTKRGYLKKYDGEVDYQKGCFLLTNKDKEHQKQTNRRIRYMKISEELPSNFSGCKKMLEPRRY